MVELNPSDQMIESMKALTNSIVRKREIALVVALFFVGLAAGELIPFFPISVGGLFLMGIGWLIYANALEKKVEILRQLWAYVTRAKSKEISLFHEPERAKSVELELKRLMQEFKSVYEKMEKDVAEIRSYSLKGLMMYSFGAGLLAGELGSRCSGYCQVLASVLFSAILLAPLSMMIGHLKDWRSK
ncbi:hypothetical protein IPA_08405 [Ignicoccus pacificus DSM 13166]|uniref:Uncharacterized protein n=1 Tax=Ignicoccus pacificus DSM 13166 TaxID=940294 RepID=A0A977KBV6_9CREN|nr:hypothetical protein IPA_08405 [Ignicoccus pacificus DSM 13166]